MWSAVYKSRSHVQAFSNDSTERYQRHQYCFEKSRSAKNGLPLPALQCNTIVIVSKLCEGVELLIHLLIENLKIPAANIELTLQNIAAIVDAISLSAYL